MRAVLATRECPISSIFKQSLEDNNIRTDWVFTGEDCFHLCNLYGYDIIILDIAFGDEDGFLTLERIRKKGIHTPIIIYSYQDSVESRVKALDMGADDFVSKEQSITETISRIRSIVRRSWGHAHSAIDIGELKIDLQRQTVSLDEELLKLTKTEYAILELLALRRGVMVGKEVFLNHLYGGIDEPELKIIDVFVCKLRKKLTSFGNGKNYIKTIWGRGYILEEDIPPRNAQIAS